MPRTNIKNSQKNIRATLEPHLFCDKNEKKIFSDQALIIKNNVIQKSRYLNISLDYLLINSI